MQRYDDRSFMQEPGICFLCELSPSDGVGFVDTDRNFSPGFPSSLSGRKYVCDGCVKNLSETAGYFASEDIQEAQRRADAADARYSAVREHVARVTKDLEDDVLVSEGDKAPFNVRAKVDEEELLVPVQVEPVGGPDFVKASEAAGIVAKQEVDEEAKLRSMVRADGSFAPGAVTTEDGPTPQAVTNPRSVPDTESDDSTALAEEKPFEVGHPHGPDDAEAERPVDGETDTGVASSEGTDFKKPEPGAAVVHKSDAEINEENDIEPAAADVPADDSIKKGEDKRKSVKAPVKKDAKKKA